MKFLDPTFWKFVVAFLTMILLVLVGTQYVNNYHDDVRSAPDYIAR